MSRRGDAEFLHDILEACNRIIEYTEGMTYEEFLEDKKTQDAVLRNLEVIGEAVKNISKELKAKHDEVEWRKIAATRDKLIHFYFGVSFDVVWDVVKSKIPNLRDRVLEILDEL